MDKLIEYLGPSPTERSCDDIKYTSYHYQKERIKMDIKKFILYNKIDNDYNKMIQLEIDAIKHKTHEKSKQQCIYKVSECDFLKPKSMIQRRI